MHVEVFLWNMFSLLQMQGVPKMMWLNWLGKVNESKHFHSQGLTRRHFLIVIDFWGWLRSYTINDLDHVDDLGNCGSVRLKRFTPLNASALLKRQNSSKVEPIGEDDQEVEKVIDKGGGNQYSNNEFDWRGTLEWGCCGICWEFSAFSANNLTSWQFIFGVRDEAQPERMCVPWQALKINGHF